MGLDLIKQYLIGIGFNVDSKSIKNAEDSIGQTEEKIKKFNENSNKGFSETNESMKNLFSLFSSTGTIGNLFPGLKKPFNDLIKDMRLAKKLYKNLSETSVKKNNNINDEDKENNLQSSFKNVSEGIVKAKKKLKGFNENSRKHLKGVEKSAKKLSSNGGKSLLKFSLKGASSFAAVIASIIVLIALIKKLSNCLGDLAQQDIGYEKLSRQLWTTKENAREIDGALKTLGVTMHDLWLSPTLLKQFNQLRKDSARLKLPKEFQNNIKVIQGISLEFKRLKQLGTLAFQWIGNYILKYAAGPLSDLKQGIHNFNDWLIKNVPKIAKFIGSIIGIILKILLIGSKIVLTVWKITTPIRTIFKLINEFPEPLKKLIKMIGLISLAISTGPIGVILLVIALLDDLFTFLRGGKSIIGSTFEFFKEKGSNAIDNIKDKFNNLKDRFKEGMTSIKDDWNSYWDKASETLDKLKNKAKKVWGKIKECSKGLWDKAKDFAANINTKVDLYNNQMSDGNSTPASYLMNDNTSNSTSNTNSNNKINNSNTINVYGTDPKSTANEVDKKFTGINTRNLQGVF